MKQDKKQPKKSAVKPTVKRPSVGGRREVQAGGGAGAGEAAAAVATQVKPATMAPEGQAEIFDRAVTLFHSKEFAAARALFSQVAKGPVREMAHSARQYVRMCEHRIAGAALELASADERYDYAVALINGRQLALAEDQLRRALAAGGDFEYVHYALALCLGLKGELEEAYDHLKRAIELQPRNRQAARNDPDFAEISRRRPICDLLYP